MSGIKMSQQKEKVSIPPTVTLSVPQEPYAPGYSASYTPEPYAPQPYNPQMYAPQSYSSEPQSYKQYASSDPYAPDVSANEHYRVTDACCYEVSSPPPYSCEEVPCDTLGPVCMDSSPPVVVAGIFSSKPASTICPCCRQIITTEVVFRVGCLTYALSTCLCLVGCCLGCCLIPFMSKCCKDVDHYCPCCRYHIYRYKRI